MSSPYKISRLCLTKENPKTNFILVNKINTDDDNDCNVILSMTNEIYIKEFDKILKINNINSITYDSENKTQNYNNKIEYTLKENLVVCDNENVEINNIVNTLESYMGNIKEKYELISKDPLTEPVPEPVIEPVIEPVTEPPVTDHVNTESVIEPVNTESVIEPVKRYRIKLKKPILLDLLENDTTSDIEDKIQYHLKLIASETNNIILIITKLVKFIDNFAIEGTIKKTIVISAIKKFLSDENNQWEEHQSDDGRTYWWNKITDISTWMNPNIADVDYVINTICPSLIDILISVDKRKIILRKKPSCCFVS